MTPAEDALAAAQDRLNALAQQDIADHVEAFEEIHRALSDALSSIDNL